MSDHAELIARLEAAEAGSRELDFAVAQSLGSVVREGWAETYADGTFGGSVKAYTTSVEAALALAERLIPGVWWVIGRGKLTSGEPEYGAELLFGPDESLGIAEAATAPLALCIAILRASPTTVNNKGET